MNDALRRFKSEIFQGLAHPTRIAILEQLRDRKVTFRSITEGMDTSNYLGRFVFTILGAVAEMEREITRCPRTT